MQLNIYKFEGDCYNAKMKRKKNEHKEKKNKKCVNFKFVKPVERELMMVINETNHGNQAACI